MINLLKKAINNVRMKTVMQSTIDVCARRVKIQVQVAQALYEGEVFYGSLGSALQLSSENFK